MNIMDQPYRPCVSVPIKRSNNRTTPRVRSPKKRTPVDRKALKKSNFLLRSFYSNLHNSRTNRPTKSKNKPKTDENVKTGKQAFYDDTDEAAALAERIRMKQKALDKLKAEYEEEKSDIESSSESEYSVIVSEEESTDSGELTSDSEEDSSEEEEIPEKEEVQGREEVKEREEKEERKDSQKKEASKSTEENGFTELEKDVMERVARESRREAEMERQAVEEILQETRRVTAVANKTGTWLKPVVPNTNKRFLRNLLVSTLQHPIKRRGAYSNRRPDWYMKAQNEFGDSLWKDRYERRVSEKQQLREEWKYYNSSSYFTTHRENMRRRKEEERARRDEEKWRRREEKLRRKEEGWEDEEEEYTVRERRVKGKRVKKSKKEKSSHRRSPPRDDDDDDTGRLSPDVDDYLDFKDIIGEKKEEKDEECTGQRLDERSEDVGQRLEETGKVWYSDEEDALYAAQREEEEKRKKHKRYHKHKKRKHREMRITQPIDMTSQYRDQYVRPKRRRHRDR